MAETAQEKTEKPTQRRRDEAKDKGNVAKSTELNSVVVLFTGVFSLKLTLSAFGGSFGEFLVMIYHDSCSIELTPQALPLLIMAVVKISVLLLLPVLISVMVAGAAANFAQVGPLYAKKALAPDFKKLNPFSGIKGMISPMALVEILKGIIKIIILAWVSYSVIGKYIDDLANWSYVSIGEIFTIIVSILWELSMKAGLALFIMAAADFGYQKYQHEKKLKMSKEEIKEEAKQYEGNPVIKGAIKSKQKQLARMRMMKAVPEATVVVTNPTHIAIALKYEPSSKSDAPKVIAKGKRKVAERIKQIARENGIPIIENKPLARGLFQACEVGMEIPVAFYQAVAEVLTQVYKMNKDKLPQLAQ